MSNKKEELISLMAAAYLDRASPDGGISESEDFAIDYTLAMSNEEVDDWLKDVADGYEVVFRPDIYNFDIFNPELGEEGDYDE